MPHPGTTIPRDPSTADDVIIEVGLRCLADAVEPPEIRTTGENSYTLTYVHGPDGVNCPPELPPGTAFPTNIGKFPAGQHHVHFIGLVNGQSAYTDDISFTVSDIAGQSVSGAWFDPQQSGRGIFIVRTTAVGTYPPTEPLFIVYWANHDADGNPTWALTSGQMTNHVVSGTAVYTTGTPLAPGTAELAQQEWGQLSFEYLGCDKGRLTWNALDQTITDGSVDIIKLANPDGQEVCSIPSAIEAVWTD